MNEDNLIRYGEPLPKEYETLGREELQTRLSLYIEVLLNTNFEKLCNMIYRHDVEESKFNMALQAEQVQEQAARIADLVIDRELQKVESRKAYRKYKNEQKSLEKEDGLEED